MVAALTLLIQMPAADVKLAEIFQSGMVLQRGNATPVYGTATPGETVTVEVGPAKGRAKADPHGNFTVKLKTPAVGGPYLLKVTSPGGSAQLEDVLVGDVWICSGQSNMEWEADWFANRRFEIGASDFPKMRLFKHERRISTTPQTEALGKWTASTARSGRKFTLVGFLFGREVHEKVGVPIGLIESAWGGTPAESWIDLKSLEAKPELASLAKKFHDGESNPSPTDPWLPTGLYNGMIAPLTPFAVRGAIWYQGESNVGRAKEYSVLFPSMIEAWRRIWNNPKLDFYFVQLAAYGNPQDSTTDSGWAELREAQTAALQLRGTGMAVAIDAGEEKDIHPIRKDLVGHRLAVAALAKTYGQKTEYLGPSPKSIKEKDGKLVIRMERAKGLKSLDGSPLKGFAVAGSDGKFFVAEATIQKEELLVSSKDVPKPVQVRYAWADYVPANLGNGVDLPAAPFRMKVK